ncbi:MAG: hypothetical protein KJO55_05410, partial [Gammaproteobacteria bacterium]|nr:hypothetical protein [Gammaproteobacteria bacterium]
MPRHLHRLPRLLAILLTCALSLPALAAPPPVINYQGYLADSDSAPISEMLLISFAIYDVPGGGAPLWSETQLVAVDGGLFNVKLGASIPLPADVASAPRYLGITVESDAEMVPRQEIASSMFAFAAADAELLGGAPASDYDQSAHVGATGNPHSVTASEVGAATPADITAHAGDAAAHHAPYTDGQAVAAILANDGTGSGLDADSVDGVSAEAFLQPGSDFGRPGVAGQLFEGNQTLTNLYVNEGQLNSIAGEMILDGSIGQLDIATNGVGAAEIAAGAVGSAEIAPGAVGISELASDSVTPSKINWSLNHADSDLNGGLISVQNTSDGTPGNFPMGLAGAVSGSSGASGSLIGVAGLSPGLGLGAPVSDLPVGTKYGVVGVVDIGTAVAAITNSGIGLYADGTTMATKGIGANGPTVGYSGVQG